jgi:hypothetical protein
MSRSNSHSLQVSGEFWGDIFLSSAFLHRLQAEVRISEADIIECKPPVACSEWRTESTLYRPVNNTRTAATNVEDLAKWRALMRN